MDNLTFRPMPPVNLGPAMERLSPLARWAVVNLDTPEKIRAFDEIVSRLIASGEGNPVAAIAEYEQSHVRA